MTQSFTRKKYNRKNHLKRIGMDAKDFILKKMKGKKIEIFKISLIQNIVIAFCTRDFSIRRFVLIEEKLCGMEAFKEQKVHETVS